MTWTAGFTFCASHALPPYRELRRTFVEVYLRELEAQQPQPANATLYRRIATLSSWFRWLEDEDLTVGKPAARVRRPQRHPRPQPWLNRNELTDLLAAAEDEGGDAYALACLLGLNGLRVSEACNANITDLGGSRYQPTLQIIGKGDKPAEVVLNSGPNRRGPSDRRRSTGPSFAINGAGGCSRTTPLPSSAVSRAPR